MENFALIALAGELRAEIVGMTVRRVTRFPGDVFFLETRSGRMPGLRISLDPQHPGVWVPRHTVVPKTDPDDFLMLLRKHLQNGRLTDLRKPLSERVLELDFLTTLPAEELGEVTLVVELLGNATNLLLLDRGRRILAWARQPARRRGLSLYDEYRHPETRKVPLDAVLSEDGSWLDPEGFSQDRAGWLLSTLAGVGPVLANELTERASGWPETSEGIREELRRVVGTLRAPVRTVWVYTTRPLGAVLETGDLASLGGALISPIELHSQRERMSFQTFPGMIPAAAAVADALESARHLERARAPELRRIRREIRRLETRRERLLTRRRRFEGAEDLQATARLLSSSGIEMDRHHAEVTVTEYTDNGPLERRIALDPTRTLREQVNRMFREKQKARRGLERVGQDLSAVDEAVEGLNARERRIRGIRHWDDWLAVTEAPGPRSRGQRPAKPPPERRRRYRTRVVDGYEILIGRNGRENDELTFRVAAPGDFWFHVADYSGSHVIVRNPSRVDELPEEVLTAAAALAAYHSQARNSARVEVHFTERKFVTRPRKAPPGLVRIGTFRSVVVEPRDKAEEP